MKNEIKNTTTEKQVWETPELLDLDSKCTSGKLTSISESGPLGTGS